MIIEITHTDGKRYRIPASQVVVRDTHNGKALALAYESSGLIVHSVATASDWPEIVRDLGLADARPVEMVKL